MASPSQPRPQTLSPGVLNTKQRNISITTECSRSSSIGTLWAEDYWGDELSAEHLSSSEYERERERIGREEKGGNTTQKSFSSLFFRGSGSPTKAKEKEEEGGGEFMATLTGDKEGTIKVADRSRGLASWFSGSSAPVAVGIPLSSSDAEAEEQELSRDSTPGKLRKRPTLSSMDSGSSTSTTPSKTSTNTGTSRFNFFGGSGGGNKTPNKTVQLPASLNEDEYLTLSIPSCLYSNSPIDPFSPSSFKNLQQNAEGLLLKLQTAYKLRTLAYHDLKAEFSATEDELEEACTRAASLKNQLAEMASRAAEQDAVIESLVTELAIERRALAEEREAREKSVALVKSQAERTASKHTSTSSFGEDLGMGEESDGESGGESVFSRSRSPAFTVSTMGSRGTAESTPEIGQAAFARVVANPAHAQAQSQSRPKPVKQKSTFEKMLGMGSEDPGVQGQWERGEEGGCINCRGKDASVAWDTVGLLRAENRGLKERVGGLEGAVEDAIGLCGGLRRL